MMQGFNNDEEENLNEKFQIGEEIDIEVVSLKEDGLVLGVPIVKVKEGEKRIRQGNELIEGLLVNATVKSKKGYFAYLQLPL